MPGFGYGFGFGAVRRRVGKPAPPPPLRAISTQNRINIAADTRAFTDQYVRWPVVLAADASDMVLSWDNYYQSGGELLTGNAITMLEYAVERSATRDSAVVASAAVRFSGSRTASVPNGAVGFQSDAILPSAFGLTKFTAGEVYWVKGVHRVPNTSSFIPASDRATSNFPGSQAMWFPPASLTLSPVDTLGPFTFTGSGGTSTGRGWCPIVLGHPLVDRPSFLGIGASVMAMTGDTGAGTTLENGAGFFQRAMHDAGASMNNLRPSINVSARGVAAHVHYTGTNTRWRSLIPYCRHAVCDLGVGTLGTGSGVALSALTTPESEIYAALRAGGISKIARSGLIPRTTSTDNWQSVAQQTPLPGFVAGGVAEQFNTWAQARVADRSIDAFVAMSSTRPSATPTAWIVDGSVYYATSDGINPVSWLHEAMAVELRAAIQGFW